jgi:hypothetical protein
MKKILTVFMVVFFFTLVFYLLFFNYTEPTQFGIARNKITGKMWIQEGGGVYLTWPWVWVVRVDTKPIRVAVVSGGRGYSAKLVQFEKRGWKEFVAVEGWRYYWWSNRISFNLGYDDEYRGMKDILRGYAYGAKSYSFMTVLKEYYAKN